MAVDPVSLAITVALTAANMALTASQTFEGPRVKGTPATLADYGTPLNYFLGTRLMSCPCFFAKPIAEVRKKRKGKGGKQVSYTGYGTWAVHIADHEIGGILQVWFDNHLIYDATGSEVKIYPLADTYELESSMRIYLGTEAQTADSDMQAYIEDRDGPDTCPAYKGTSYIYFQDVPLENLGNRYPDVKVLAYEGGAITQADDNDIGFVGQMGHEVDTDVAVTDVPFALTNGLAATPADGDLVMIAVTASSLSTASPRNPTPAISGYEPLFDPMVLSADFNEAGFGIYYKFMGATPDTTWSSETNTGSKGQTAYQVVVFRGVDPADFLAAAVGTTSIATATSGAINPPNIVFSGGIVDPGTIETTAVPRKLFGVSFALRALTGQALPIAAGGTSLSDSFEVGNFTTVYYTNSAGARSATAAFVWGGEYLIGEGTTLGHLLTKMSETAGLDADEYDYSLVFGQDHAFDGFNWSQADGRTIGEAMCDLFDVDIRPHDFKLQAWPRGSATLGTIETGKFAAKDRAAPFTIPDASESSLPARIFLTFADTTAEQAPNVAQPQAGEAGSGEASIDMQTLALTPTRAQELVERRQRRERFGRVSAELSLTRQNLALEPGDVMTPEFDGDPMVMRCTKVTIGADGKFPTEWKRDDPAVAIVPGATGAAANGYIPDTMPDPVATEGLVMDLPLLVDAHDQSAPLAYLAAGPAGPGTWIGADFAVSDTGELDSYTTGWDGIAAENGAIIGTCTGALPDVDPWVSDTGSSIEVTINAGELVSATLDELILDGTRNLAAIKSGSGWELVQFMTPTLTADLTYTITGFLRGVRGTEWAMAGHAPGDEFILLDYAKRHTLGASEIGDTDYYIASTYGVEPDQSEAFTLAFTGASHKPYAAVYADVTQSGSDWLFDATRRTRIGGNTLDGQDVPLGEASESWSLDIYNGASVVRTITGTSLPLTYTAADQTTDFGAPVGTVTAILYQLDPTLNLRGYPLALAA